MSSENGSSHRRSSSGDNSHVILLQFISLAANEHRCCEKEDRRKSKATNVVD